MRISDWRSDVCSSDLPVEVIKPPGRIADCSVEIENYGAHRVLLDRLFEFLVFRRRAGRRVGARSRSLVHLASCSSSVRLSLRASRGPILPKQACQDVLQRSDQRTEEHTSELQSLMRISYAVFCLITKNNTTHISQSTYHNKKLINK